jgi:hypothetical protein
MLNVIMLSVGKLNVGMLNVIMLSVVDPCTNQILLKVSWAEFFNSRLGRI